MELKRTLELLRIEHECVRRNGDGCDRDCANCDLVQQDTELLDMYEGVIERLERQQWVKCSERMPEKAGEYLVCMLGHVYSSCFDGNVFVEYRAGMDEDGQFEECECDIYPDYWMPLPEAPVEEEVKH